MDKWALGVDEKSTVLDISDKEDLTNNHIALMKSRRENPEGCAFLCSCSCEEQENSSTACKIFVFSFIAQQNVGVSPGRGEGEGNGGGGGNPIWKGRGCSSYRLVS